MEVTLLSCQILTRKKKYLNICVSVWGLMFFSWWPCFIRLGASPLWSIAKLSQAVRVKGKERYLILSPSLSLSQTQRAQEIRSDFHVIFYIFPDEEEKSRLWSIELNFLVTASFVTSLTAEMFNSIWSSFRIKKENQYCQFWALWVLRLEKHCNYVDLESRESVAEKILN